MNGHASELLPTPAMARRARVPASWLRAEAEAGRIPHLRAGARLLFHPATVEKLLFERARSGFESGQTTDRHPDGGGEAT